MSADQPESQELSLSHRDVDRARRELSTPLHDASWSQAQAQVLFEAHVAERNCPQMQAEKKAAVIPDETERKRALEAIRGGTPAVEGRRELTSAEIAAKARADVQQERAKEAELASMRTDGDALRGQPDLGSDFWARNQPTCSHAQWAQPYEVKDNSDQSISYCRDGEQRFVDRGNRIILVSSDERSIKDAVSLARERWGSTIRVNVANEQKCDAVFREMAKQDMHLGGQDRAQHNRFAEISKAVERERLQSQFARPQRVEQREAQSQGIRQ